jgi:hypothetical protein
MHVATCGCLLTSYQCCKYAAGGQGQEKGLNHLGASLQYRKGLVYCKEILGAMLEEACLKKG